MDERKDSLLQVLKKVEDLQLSMQDIEGDVSPTVIEKIIDMFHRFFRTFLSDFEQDQFRFRETFKGITSGGNDNGYNEIEYYAD